jgi:hypothetical protein
MRFDVGVDTEWDRRRYFPVSIEQIEARIESARSEHPEPTTSGDPRGAEVVSTRASGV